MTIDAQTDSEAFPVTWQNPGDEARPWFQDVMHCPLPMAPLDATLTQPAFAEGASRGIGALSMPISGLDVVVQNGYVYLGPRLVTGTPTEMAARFGEMQRIMMEIGPTLLRDWEQTFEPDVLARIDRILGFTYDAASAAERARFLLSLRADLADVWEIHMRVVIPTQGLVFALEEMLSSILGPEVLSRSRLMLQGFVNKSTEMGQAFWALSRWVRSDEGLRAAVMRALVRNGAVEMDDTPLREEFYRRWAALLDAYGWRTDRDLEIACPTWLEDPSTPLTQLKHYVGQDDAADPFKILEAHREGRERVTAELEAALPEEARPQFRGMLAMAQQFLPVEENHNFTIDQKFTAVMRHAALKLGEALVSEGVLRHAEDVCYLRVDEIEAIAGGATPDALDGQAQQRRREQGRQAALRAPLMLGTPPPADAPPDPLITKFFGIGLAPSQDVNVVTGHACSAGAVTGIVKVVPTLDEAGKLEPGDILVCRRTVPSWTPLFGIAGAVVADSGGPLSHCAIVAREYGIPCVAGTVNGTSVLRDGIRVRVDGDTGIVSVLDDKAGRG